ncbi:MAG: hypothetical protein U5K00_13490 [Melioribacteraceae bacterium]|nr:hypothetical protein [Melioribacteraceae bacterium]
MHLYYKATIILSMFRIFQMGHSQTFCYDWYEIEYPRYNKLVNDSLIITIPDGLNNEVVQLKFTNANESEYEIFKVSGNSKRLKIIPLIMEN